MKRLKEYSTLVLWYPLPKSANFWEDARPWKNSGGDSKELMEQMALQQAIRQRGGVLPSERLMLCLYIADAGDQCHENGRPTKVRELHFKVGKGET